MNTKQLLLCQIFILFCINAIAQNADKKPQFTMGVSAGLSLPFSNYGLNDYEKGGYAAIGSAYALEAKYLIRSVTHYFVNRSAYMGNAFVLRAGFTKNPFNTNEFIKNQRDNTKYYVIKLETEARGYSCLDLMAGVNIVLLYNSKVYPSFKFMAGMMFINKGSLNTQGKVTADEGETVDYFSYHIDKQKSTKFVWSVGAMANVTINPKWLFILNLDYLKSSGHHFIVTPSNEEPESIEINIVNLIISPGLVFKF